MKTILAFIFIFSFCACIKTAPNRLTVKAEVDFDSAYVVVKDFDTIQFFTQRQIVFTFDNVENGTNKCLIFGRHRQDTIKASMKINWKTFSDNKDDYVFLEPGETVKVKCYEVK